MSGLRIALVAAEGDDAAHELWSGLRACGDQPEVLTGRAWPAIEHRLERRGYEGGLTRLPSLLGSLRAQQPQLVHAFGVVEAAASARWAGRTHRPLLLSLVRRVDRPWIMERRMRLPLLLRAARQCQAILVGSEADAAALRWELGLDAVRIDAGSGAAHHALYQQLIGPEAEPPRVR